MGNFINANINAGRFFVRKSRLTPKPGVKLPDYYIEVFDSQGASVGRTGVWANTDKNGETYFSGDLAAVTRDEDRERYVLKPIKADTAPTVRASTDPFEKSDF